MGIPLVIKLKLVRKINTLQGRVMQKEQFEQAITRIRSRDKRFEREAYFFLKEALDYTVQDISTQARENSKHVSASQLLHGFRDLALKEFGPMAATLFNEWGIQSCGDIGDMVFLLIKEGVFGKQDNDRPEDFIEIFSFESVFVTPFLPQRDGKVT
jgi:uncharacterized repeat protein (TIGR04138 family)